MGLQQFYLEISFRGFNMCTDLHMVELSESTNGNKSVVTDLLGYSLLLPVCHLLPIQWV